MLKKILNPLVLKFQAMIAEALVVSTQKKEKAYPVGGVHFYLGEKAPDPRGIHENHYVCRVENHGKKYPYSSKRQKERHVVSPSS